VSCAAASAGSTVIQTGSWGFSTSRAFFYDQNLTVLRETL
jgi:hypothetical protein